MFPPSNTVARWTKGDELFERWAENLETATGLDTAVEVFVELGGGGGAALYVFDGKNYWSPVYEELADRNQFERETGHDAGVHSAWDDYEFDPEEWAWHVSWDEYQYLNVGTRVPLVY